VGGGSHLFSWLAWLCWISGNVGGGGVTDVV